MVKINGTKDILGGLVAGVVINIFEFVLNGVIINKDMEDAVRALGRQMGIGEPCGRERGELPEPKNNQRLRAWR